MADPQCPRTSAKNETRRPSLPATALEREVLRTVATWERAGYLKPDVRD